MEDTKLRMGCSPAQSGGSKSARERGKWGSKKEFILSVVGAVIGLGNVWRFPYLCYKNGGGIGYASQMIIFYGSISYIVILAWAFLYLFSSFSEDLPWANCNNAWNTDACFVLNNFNASANGTSVNASSSSSLSSSSSVLEFWQRRVLNISSGIEEVGSVQWELSLCLLLAWIICYFCVWKGVRSTGKATYFTATFPFLMLAVLFVRGMTLPGAMHGIKYYLWPNPARLADPQVWMDAGTQIFYSYAICLGCLTTLGSYNPYHNNCYSVDSDSHKKENKNLNEISWCGHYWSLRSGPGLVFIVYPQAVTLLPWPQVWSVCFFTMIILLGIDGQFVGLESLMTSITDMFPDQIQRGYRREILLMLLCAFCYLMGLSLVSQAGAYILQIFDHYVCSGPTLLLMAIIQSVIIGWIYGAERFSSNIKDMIGYKPLSLIKYCWLYTTPLVCSGTLIFLILKFSPLRFNNTYIYPWWAYYVGWFLASSSLIMIPLTMICKLANGKGTLWQRLKTSSRPADDLPMVVKR
ncbi:sodium- and chloride-dependent GABA transporter 2-like [Cynoglossus semilaevis]|uniref:sodium- and chloride-dependent GABA transporter 2-like n=1 Tax=Cynoglossus semilaevis TaxID=244447 RepID=UPI000D62B5E8|nr:sodium- and chloride-dependent GABA transporter 2-like [Cynoglossus semilaevis]